MDFKDPMDSYHPAPATLVALEATAPLPQADMELSLSALEAQAGSPASAGYMEWQTVFTDQLLGLEAQASDQEAHLQVPPLGLEQMPETALPQQAHKDLSEALWAEPAIIHNSQFSFPLIMPQAMVVMVLAASVD